MYKYLTLEQTIKSNGDRHLERAVAYASAGYPDRFYEGSIRKALKNYHKSKNVKIPLDKISIKILEPFIDYLNKQIAENILKGSSK